MAKLQQAWTLGRLLSAFEHAERKHELFHKYRQEAVTRAAKVYEERAASLNVDAPPYQEMAFGPLTGAEEVFKRAKRLVSILTPLRVEPMLASDINRALDLCVDNINYLSWVYAMLKIATGMSGNPGSNDAPDYMEEK